VRRAPSILLVLCFLPALLAPFGCSRKLHSRNLTVQIDGVSGAPRKNIEAAVGIAASAARRRAVSDDDIHRLHERAPEEIALALQPFGYYAARVESHLDRRLGRWQARYVIDPGPVVKVRSLSVELRGEGRTEPAFQRLVTKFPLAQGDALWHGLYEAGKTSFIRVAADSGYLDAVFDTAAVLVDLDALAADITVHFDTGPRFRFGEVTFEQDVVDESVLRSLVTFSPGTPFRSPLLIDLQQALSDVGYFSRVEVKPRRDRARGLEVPIEVELGPKRRTRWEVGAGYGTDTGPRLTLKLSLRRLNRVGHNSELEGRVSAIEQSVSGRYLMPSMYPSTWLKSVFAGYQRLDPSTSKSEKYSVGVSAGHRRWGIEETWSLRFEHENFTVGLDEGKSDLLMPGLEWMHVRADDRIFTGKGRRLRLYLDGAHDGVASSATFLRTKFEGKAIATYTPKARFIARAELGRTFTSQFRDLPPTIRFFAGGDQSVRGYEYRSLGPTDEEGTVVGGDVIMVASVETDYYFARKWGVALFFDAGNAYSSSLRQKLAKGTGAGLRWRSPIGLVRVDGAVALDDNNKFRVHFVIGPDL